ncbi:MAG: 50S ribosomal protein L24 [Spirochaetaceae bacterium]|jgi:large subunit ribosomal protein L24|nr:50S ribosomal protein L24 [Spirochaetaceae bacterium]GMO17771.1 MAG: 50S ribosomal protein L24 [Termitinemataceae bacterium]
MAQIAKQHKFKLKREDTVEIIAGKDKGKRGRVLKILRDKERVLVEGANIVKKTQKKRNNNDRGGIIELEAPLHVSNIMVVCKKCGPTRLGYKIDGEKKTRVCKKCGDAL